MESNKGESADSVSAADLSGNIPLEEGFLYGSYICPVQLAINVVGGKWKPLILYQLLQGTKRYSQLKNLIPGITQRMLTLQLRELERDRIIDRLVYPQVPTRVDYSMTEFGLSLKPILLLMADWGYEYVHRMRENE